MPCCRNDNKVLDSRNLKACVSIKFRSHRVGPTNQLTPNMCLDCFYHFQRMTFIYLLLLLFFLSHLVHSTVVHCIFLWARFQWSRCCRLNVHEHISNTRYITSWKAARFESGTKNACFVAALVWTCNMRRTTLKCFEFSTGLGAPKVGAALVARVWSNFLNILLARYQLDKKNQ